MPINEDAEGSRISGEFEGAELGDARLERRLIRLAEMIAAEPKASFPTASRDDAELEATYRFLGNQSVSAQQILAPHLRQTQRRSRAAAQLVVAHDSTEFNFGSSPRTDLGRVGRGKSFGFYGHFALAIDAGAQRKALGLVAFEVRKRSGGKGRRGHAALQADPDNEFHRWRRVVDDAQQALDGLTAIHVMDREADSYAFMAELAEQGRRFVIRMAQSTRRLADEDANVAQVLVGAQILAEREVALSPRSESKLPSYRKRHPQRSARIAKLQVSAMRVSLARPDSASASPTKSLALNVVRVLEPNPPADQVPVEWRLWTTEPIDTPEQVLGVVDFYRCRWRIEEYFKALKTGCSIEKRQLETYQSLVNAMAVLCPIAWRLLLLRTLAQDSSGSPADVVLNPRQLLCLRAALKKRRRPALPDRPTVRDVMLGVATLGGHLKRNGDPGWITLGRGMDKLLSIEFGFCLAREADQEM